MKPGIFRLLLACIVVLHHSFPLRLGSIAVGLFFILSGYWIAVMWHRKYSAQDRPYRAFLISRWWRLAPVFLFVQVLAATVAILSEKQTGGDLANDSRWWLSQFCIVGNGCIGRLVPPSWSLDVEMQFYIVAPLLLTALAVASHATRVALVATLVAWMWVCIAQGASLETPRIDIYLGLFAIGIAAALSSANRPLMAKPYMSLKLAALLLTLLMLVAAMPDLRPLIWRSGSDAVELSLPLVATFNVLAIGLAAPLAIDTVSRPSDGRDRWLGDLSYPVYMFHWLPRDWYYGALDWARPAWWNASLLGINLTMALSGGVLILMFVDHPAQRLRTRWISRQKLPGRSRVSDIATT